MLAIRHHPAREQAMMHMDDPMIRWFTGSTRASCNR